MCIKNVVHNHWLQVKSLIFHCTGVIITGGSPPKTDVEVFPANTSCTIPPFPSPGKLSSCSSSHCNCCQRENSALPLCDQWHPCGVRWIWHQEIVHIVEERTGGLGGLPYFEVKLSAFITNTSNNNTLILMLWSFKQLLHHHNSKNIFLFSQERYYHAAVVVDGGADILLLGGYGSSKTTGEIVKSE